MTPMDDARFDAAMRAHYRAAAHAVPPQLRARLHPRAGTQAVSRWWTHWQWPAGLATAAAVGVLAIALQRLPSAPDAPPAGNRVVAAASSDDGADPLADPEFYAWLGSADAQQLAME